MRACVRPVFCWTMLSALSLACSREDVADSSWHQPKVQEVTPQQEPLPHDLATTELLARPPTAAFKEAIVKAHQSADMAIDPKDEEHAAQLLEAAFSLPAQENTTVLILRQDLAVRASTLRLRLGDLKKAELLVQQGLSLSGLPSAARAQLFITLADIEETRGQSKRATEALLAALAINQELFDKELENP